MNPATKRRLSFVLGFALYFGLLWYFWNSPVVYPLKIFVVLLHETSHALALLATGGAIERIVLDPQQGGATLGVGGSRFITLSAGYLGSLAWGMALVQAGRSRWLPPRLVNAVIGAAVIALTLFYVGNVFGIGFGLAFGTAVMVAARFLPVVWNRRLLLTLGLTSCLYAILDIKSDILDRPHLQSDASMLADLTGVPTLIWGGLWIGLAVVASLRLLRSAYRTA